MATDVKSGFRQNRRKTPQSVVYKLKHAGFDQVSGRSFLSRIGIKSKGVDALLLKILSKKIVSDLKPAFPFAISLAFDETIPGEYKNAINDIINTNLLGVIYSIKSVLPSFIKNESGTIINILSVVVDKTFTRSSVYSASKMGLLGYSNSLREEVRKHNIRIINIIPGATETSMWSQEIRKEKGELMMNPESMARIIVSSYLQKDNLVTEEIVLRPITGDLASRAASRSSPSC